LSTHEALVSAMGGKLTLEATADAATTNSGGKRIGKSTSGGSGIYRATVTLPFRSPTSCAGIMAWSWSR